ncbi:MAG: pilus assembly protein [Gammaproteobacteria bacterium]
MFTKKQTIFLMLPLFLLATSRVTLAEDTEIYVGANGLNSVKPNVTFIIDTSGSMGSKVTVPVVVTGGSGSYDPAQTYPGSCDTSKVYWNSKGKAPSCSTDDWFHASSNMCGDSTAALTTGSGYYLGKLARYRLKKGKRRWSSLSKKDHDDLVECKNDYGSHGDGVSSNYYPADEKNGGPWISTNNKSINWNKTGKAYTLYSANYLNWKAASGGGGGGGGSVQMTRLQIVQDVFNKLMDSTSGINTTVMRFDNKSRSANKGGYFLLPMQELNDTTRAGIKSAVSALSPGGYTPLAETLYESVQFYRGGNVFFGNSTSPGTNHSGVLVSGNSSKYLSPIDFQCQKNFTVLLTDGQPTYDGDADSQINSLPGFSGIAGSCGYSSDDCLDELAHYTYTKDQRNDLNDTQNIITYTIGFHTNQQLLQDTATKGGGQYYTASDTSGLTDAFTSIITNILATNDTFVAPAVAVNAFNRLTHRDELYFALFRPSGSPKWAGNLKHYKLAGQPVIITDAGGQPAVDPNTGFFDKNSTSFWTPAAIAPDGDNVALGGAASILGTTRNIYTYTGTSAPNNESLTSSTNAFHESNAAITKSMLGIPTQTDAYRTSLLQWSRGIDVFDENEDGNTNDSRQSMGDPLHSKPLLVTYGGTDTSPDITLFVGTNEGYLHAFNASTGAELFSFIPQEVLPNLDKFYLGSSAEPHPYGLDGPITAWVNDANQNNIIESGEHVYVYIGMRRGGRNYYALDVTNRSAPVLKWRIIGGTGDFTELGETWSAPIHSKIKINGIEKNVLIFGGGYDTNQDVSGPSTADTQGRAIYIVDATTGQRLWWAGPAGSNLPLTAMTNSIPSDIKPVDIDADGYTDLMYVGDMKGQIWRFDFDNAGNTGVSNLATGGVVAKFGGATAADARRFYYAPDVVYSKFNGAHTFYINIGSGYRAHPLDKSIQETFYSFRDPDVFTTPTSYTFVTESDLYDATDNIIGEGSASQKSAALTSLNSGSGWYIKLHNGGIYEGEKVQGIATTINNMILFTTFTPVASTQTSCSPSRGVATLYAISLFDATPVQNLDLVGDVNSLTKSDRKKTLVRGGIPPEVTILFPKGNPPLVCVGPECLTDIPIDNSMQKLYWREE